MKWPLVKITEICHPKQWPTISKAEMLPSGYPVFGANGQIGYYSKFNHEQPTILITCRGATCGSINVCEPKSYVTGNAMALDALDKAKADLRFVTRALESADFSTVITGVAQPQITRQTLSRLQIPLPPLAEQKRIAAILDAADALRAKRRETLAQLDTLLQSTFLDMFGDPETREWPMATVEEVALPKKGSIRTGPFGSQLLHSEFVDEGIRVLGIDNAVANEFREGEARYITHEKYKHLRRYTVRPGDVLITIMGTCGRCAIVPAGIEKSINTKHLCCITLDPEKCMPGFMHAYFLRHRLARTYLERNSKGAIMSGLNMGIIKKMPILLPPLPLQRRFAAIVESAEQQKTRLRAHLAELDTLFAALQHRAFNGALDA